MYRARRHPAVRGSRVTTLPPHHSHSVTFLLQFTIITEKKAESFDLSLKGSMNFDNETFPRATEVNPNYESNGTLITHS